MKIEYFSPYVILMIKYRQMTWALHVARIFVGERRGSHRVLVGKR